MRQEMRGALIGAAAAISAIRMAPSTGSVGRTPPSAAALHEAAVLDEARAATAPPDEAEVLRNAAADLRGAARLILDREGRLCTHLSESDRAHPPFLSPAGIESVQMLPAEDGGVAQSSVAESRGAEVLIRVSARTTAQQIIRLVRCHMAWRDAVGPHVADAFADPFMVGAPEVSFVELQTGFAIRIRGRDKVEGRAILQRAQRLAGESVAP